MAKFPYDAVVIGPVENKQAAIDFMAALEYAISPSIGLVAVGEDPYSAPTHLAVSSPISDAMRSVLVGETVISPEVTALLGTFSIDIVDRPADPYTHFEAVIAALNLQQTVVSAAP